MECIPIISPYTTRHDVVMEECFIVQSTQRWMESSLLSVWSGYVLYTPFCHHCDGRHTPKLEEHVRQRDLEVFACGIDRMILQSRRSFTGWPVGHWSFLLHLLGGSEKLSMAVRGYGCGIAHGQGHGHCSAMDWVNITPRSTSLGGFCGHSIFLFFTCIFTTSLQKFNILRKTIFLYRAYFVVLLCSYPFSPHRRL